MRADFPIFRSEFQFHMVRLKASCPFRHRSPVPEISIPHGTIKRRWHFDKMVRCVISIPHGTIKSCKSPYLLFPGQISIPHGTIKSLREGGESNPAQIISIPHGTIKRGCKKVGQAPCFISIPHGTIKSAVCGYENGFCRIFQFHMVRLKVSYSLIN